MIPILKDGKPVGMVSSNFLVELNEDFVTTMNFSTIFGNCSAKWLDLKLSQTTDVVYVKKAQITGWCL